MARWRLRPYCSLYALEQLIPGECACAGGHFRKSGRSPGPAAGLAFKQLRLKQQRPPGDRRKKVRLKGDYRGRPERWKEKEWGEIRAEGG